METFERQIKLYVTETGKAPFIEWLNALRDQRTRAKIRTRLDRVRLGNLGDCAGVGEGVHELRIAYGLGYRVYFGQEGRTVVLLCGGDKHTQVDDIRQAKAYQAGEKFIWSFTNQICRTQPKAQGGIAACSKRPPSKAASPEARGVYTDVHEQAEGLRTPLEGFFNTLLLARL